MRSTIIHDLPEFSVTSYGNGLAYEIAEKATGWRPCHLEIKTARAACGDPARARYQSVKALEKIR